MSRGTLATIGMVFLLSGCASVTYAPESASVVLPDRFAYADDHANTDMPVRAAIETLLPSDDASFIALRDLAMSDSPDLQAAVARIDQARAGLRRAGAERLPNVAASASVERQRISSAQFGGAGGAGFAIDADRTQFIAGINASWDADIFGRLRASERVAALQLDAASADAVAVRLALETDVARSVSAYRMLELRVALIADDVDKANEFAALNAVRAEAGLSPASDAVRARAMADLAMARLQALEATRAAILSALSTLTTRSVVEVRSIVDKGQRLSDAQPVPQFSVPSILLRQRPDVIAAEYRLAAANSDIAAAAALRFPRLSINGALGLISLGIGGLFDNEAIIGALGAELAGPLLDFGRIGAQIDQKEALAREAFANYRGVIFQAMGEVEASLGTIAAIDRQVSALQSQLARDQDVLALVSERHRLGLDNFLAVIDAQRTLYASNDALIAAQEDALAQRILLYRAIGGLPLR